MKFKVYLEHTRSVSFNTQLVTIRTLLRCSAVSLVWINPIGIGSVLIDALKAEGWEDKITESENDIN